MRASQAGNSGTRSGRTFHKPMLSSLTMELVVECLVGLYKDHAPWEVRAALFSEVVEALGQCMATRYTSYFDNLWRVAATAFTSIVGAGQWLHCRHVVQ
jgi:hypothetical protein